MFKTIRMTFAKLLSDKRGEDLAEVSSGLSKGAKAVIACSVIAATAGGTATLATTANKASDEAGNRVAQPLGVSGGKTDPTTPSYKQAGQ